MKLSIRNWERYLVPTSCLCSTQHFFLVFSKCLGGAVLKANEDHTARLALYIILWFRGVHGLPLLQHCWHVICTKHVSSLVLGPHFCLKRYGAILITHSILRAQYRSDGRPVVHFPSSDVRRVTCETNPFIRYITSSLINTARWAFVSHTSLNVTVVPVISAEWTFQIFFAVHSICMFSEND